MKFTKYLDEELKLFIKNEGYIHKDKVKEAFFSLIPVEPNYETNISSKDIERTVKIIIKRLGL